MSHEWVLYSLIGSIFFAMLLVFFLVSIFFAISIYKTAKCIPECYHRFPIWFCWLILIPVIGIIFMWLVIPFDTPYAIKQCYRDNPTAQNEARTLFGLGLAYVILLTLSPVLGIFSIATLVLWIIYWVKIVGIRQHFSKVNN